MRRTAVLIALALFGRVARSGAVFVRPAAKK